VQLMIARSLNFVGGFEEGREDLAVWIRDAEQRGDKHAQTYLRLGSRQLSLVARGESEQAKEELANTAILSAPGSFTLEHWLRWNADVQIALYQHDGERAWNVSEETWPKLRRSMLLSHRRIRAISSNTRARAALAGADCARGSDQEKRLRVAERSVKKLSAQKEHYTSGWALARTAEIAILRGQERKARKKLESALELLPAEHMRLEWLCASRLLAQLNGYDASVTVWESELAALGIAEPPLFARVQTPTAKP